MPITKEVAERNLDQFTEKYGQEGFLKLFLTNYLFELVLLYLQSKPRKRDVDDTSYLFYVNFQGESYSTEQMDSFKTRLRKECAVRADSILKADKEFESLKYLVKDPTKNPEIYEYLGRAFDSLIKEIE